MAQLFRPFLWCFPHTAPDYVPLTAQLPQNSTNTPTAETLPKTGS